MIDSFADLGAHAIKSIQLAGNKITDVGCKALCEALIMGKDGALEGVTTLNLENNKITDSCEEDFLNVASECPNIVEIAVTGNPVEDVPSLIDHPREVFKL